MVLGAVVASVVVTAQQPGAVITLSSNQLKPWSAQNSRTLTLDRLFYDTAQGRATLPEALTATVTGTPFSRDVTMPDGRRVTVNVSPRAGGYTVQPSRTAGNRHYRLGLQHRVGSQRVLHRSHGTRRRRTAAGVVGGRHHAGDGSARADGGHDPEAHAVGVRAVLPLVARLRGIVRGTWPGTYDFARADPSRVAIRFEGPSLDMTIYTSSDPATLVKAHAADAGLPFQPPAWIYTPWRWRDEHTHRAAYYDGTPVTGPFNSEIMEDVLMMEAFGIPGGVYWIDRPWGLGQPWGYDDFEIDPKRLPNFPQMVRWLLSKGTRTTLWIAPFFQGKMAERRRPGSSRIRDRSGPPTATTIRMADMTNPAARAACGRTASPSCSAWASPVSSSTAPKRTSRTMVRLPWQTDGPFARTAMPTS